MVDRSLSLHLCKLHQNPLSSESEEDAEQPATHCTQQDSGMLLTNEREEGGNTEARQAGRVKRGLILREEEEEEARELHDLTQMSVCATYSQRTAWSDVCACLYSRIASA